MVVVDREAHLLRIVVTGQLSRVAELERALCGEANCIPKTLDVARWMHAAPPMESVERLRGTCPLTRSC